MADALAGAGVMANPAEIHGMLCGRLSGGQHLEDSACIAAIAELIDIDVASLDGLHDKLLPLYRDCIDKLHDTGFGFNLLLPDDEYELSQRLDSLALWCRGFLVGLGLSGLASETQFSNDSADALRDLAQISQVDAKELDNEKNEASFFELTEYVRMAALIIASDAQALKSDHQPTVH